MPVWATVSICGDSQCGVVEPQLRSSVFPRVVNSTGIDRYAAIARGYDRDLPLLRLPGATRLFLFCVQRDFQLLFITWLR